MKKIISFVLCLCMIFTMSVISFAEDKTVEEDITVAEGETVMVVTYGKDGVGYTEEYSVFHEGWTAAIQKSKDGNYKNVTVTLQCDWISAWGGQFTPDVRNKDGFDWDAIHFPSTCHITLDLNGFKIDRRLSTWEHNGEVMCIDSGANVVIKNGTIKGGFSCNGAGGIHMKGGNVVLENINIKGNKTDDDDGAGIAVLSGTLVMKGGSLSDNEGTVGAANVCGGGIAVFGGEVTLDNVTISNNYIHGGTRASNCGAGVYVFGGTAYLNECIIENNRTSSEGGAIYVMDKKSKIYLDKCTVTGNTADCDGNAIYLERGYCKLTNSNIYNNVNGDGDPSVYVLYGTVEFDNCYLDDEVKNVSGEEIWSSRLEEPLVLSGSLITNDSTIAIVFGAIAVVVIAGVLVFVKKKKAAEKAE